MSARSRPFTFCAPKPLEELETLKEERDEEEEDGEEEREEEELLLVVPRAQLLQVGGAEEMFDLFYYSDLSVLQSRSKYLHNPFPSCRAAWRKA